MASKSKIKGNAYERELVNIAKDFDIPAERARGSDGRSLGHVAEVDLVVGGYTIQAKRRKQLPKWMQIPDGVECVSLREDRGESYVILPYREFLELLHKNGSKA